MALNYQYAVELPAQRGKTLTSAAENTLRVFWETSEQGIFCLKAG